MDLVLVDLVLVDLVQAELVLVDLVIVDLPTSGAEKFTGGELLSTFAGPGTRGQRIAIDFLPRLENNVGRYLIIQTYARSKGNNPEPEGGLCQWLPLFRIA